MVATSSLPWQQKWSLWMNVWKELSGNTGCKCRTRMNVISKWSAQMIHCWNVAIIQSATQTSNAVIKPKTEQFPHVKRVCSFLRCFEISSITTNFKHIEIITEFIASQKKSNYFSLVASRAFHFREPPPWSVDRNNKNWRMKSCWRYKN